LAAKARITVHLVSNYNPWVLTIEIILAAGLLLYFLGWRKLPAKVERHAPVRLEVKLHGTFTPQEVRTKELQSEKPALALDVDERTPTDARQEPGDTMKAPTEGNCVPNRTPTESRQKADRYRQEFPVKRLSVICRSFFNRQEPQKAPGGNIHTSLV
jgi:hypothetical protein